MSKLPVLLLPESRHYNASVTWKASYKKCESIVNKFNDETKKRFLALPFTTFITARKNVEFSGVLVHNILMHRVHSQYEDELRFVIGNTLCRFGLTDFALITGMNFSEVPSLDERELRRRTQRLKVTYFKEFEGNRINVCHLKSAFENCKDDEDKLKLGLCYFMESIVFGSEESAEVLLDLLFFVDDFDFFINYPWGHEAYRRTLDGFKKHDLVKKRDLVGNSNKSDEQCSYSVRGYALALHIWAVECFPEFSPGFAVLQAGQLKFPRMLQWRLSKTLKYADVREKFITLKSAMQSPKHHFLTPKSDEEQTYLRSIKCSKRLVLELGLDMSQAVDEVEGNDEEPQNDSQHAIPSSPSDCEKNCLQATGSMPTTSTIGVILQAFGSFRKEVLTKFEEFGSRISRMESVQSEIHADVRCLLKDRVQPIFSSHSQEKRKGAGEKRKLMEPKTLTGITGEQMVNAQNISKAAIKRKGAGEKRKGVGENPYPHDIYVTTTPKKNRTASPVQFDLYGECIDSKQKDAFMKWLNGEADTERKVNLGIAYVTVDFFKVLCKANRWIQSEHMECYLHLLRQRIQRHPTLFPKKVSIVDPWFLRSILHQSSTEGCIREEKLMHYVTGPTHFGLLPWNEVDEVYSVLNFHDLHWVALRISVSQWSIHVYDNDPSIVDSTELQAAMNTIAYALPSMLRQANIFPNMSRVNEHLLQPFTYTRVDRDVCPRSAKTSGNCGIYALKFIELLISGCGLVCVTDDKIDAFRMQMCIDLFHQNLDP